MLKPYIEEVIIEESQESESQAESAVEQETVKRISDLKKEKVEPPLIPIVEVLDVICPIVKTKIRENSGREQILSRGREETELMVAEDIGID